MILENHSISADFGLLQEDEIGLNSESLGTLSGVRGNTISGGGSYKINAGGGYNLFSITLSLKDNAKVASETRPINRNYLPIIKG